MPRSSKKSLSISSIAPFLSVDYSPNTTTSSGSPSSSSLSAAAAGSSSSSSSSGPSSLSPYTSAIPASLVDPTLALPRLIVFDLDYTLWPFWVDTHVTPPLKINSQHTAATDRAGEEFAFYADVPAILQTLPFLPAGGGEASDGGNEAGNSGGGGNTGDGDGSSREGVKLGVASRTSAPSLARELLKGLHLPSPLSISSSSQDSTGTTTTGGDKTTSGSSGSGSGSLAGTKKAIDVFDGGMEIYPGSKVKHFEALRKRTGIRYEDMLFFDDESRNRDTEALGVTMRLVRDGVTWAEVEKGVEEWRKKRGYRMR